MALAWATLLTDIDGILSAVPGLDAPELAPNAAAILPDKAGNMVVPHQ
jgi:hypothetical protein